VPHCAGAPREKKSSYFPAIGEKKG